MGTKFIVELPPECDSKTLRAWNGVLKSFTPIDAKPARDVSQMFDIVQDLNGKMVKLYAVEEVKDGEVSD